MNRSQKRAIIITVVIPMFIFACVCTVAFIACKKNNIPNPYTIDGAEWWFECTYGYPVELDPECTKVEDRHGYTDTVWTAHLEEFPDIEFTITLDVYDGLLIPSFGMESDFYYVYGSLYLDRYREEIQSKITAAESPSHKFIVYSYYESRAEIYPLSCDMSDFDKYLKEQPVRVTTEFCLVYDDYYMNISEYGSNAIAGMYSGFTPEELSEMVFDKYISYCIQYQINLHEFTKEEQIQAVLDNNNQDTFYVIYPDIGEPVKYDDLLLRQYNDAITFGGLYEILARVEYPTLEGDATHFSFIGPDGSKYEFSYDFFALRLTTDYAGTHLNNNYYYLKDDDVIFTEPYFGNYLSKHTFNYITGYTLIPENDLPLTTVSSSDT